MLRIYKFLNFNTALIKREFTSIVFVATALLLGFLFIKNVGSFSGPDMYTAHYRASLANATSQSFAEPQRSGNNRHQYIKGSENYFNSGGDSCRKNALVVTVIHDLTRSDGLNSCIESHDKTLDNKDVKVPATLQYPPLGYLPQAIGLRVGMVMNMEPIHAQTLARILNLLVYIIIVVISIRMLPGRGRWLAVFLGLLPTSLFLASSLSADGLNIAWGFLFVSYIIRLYTQDEKVNRHQMTRLLIMGVVLFLLKVAYSPLILLVLALRGKNMSTRTNLILFFSIAVIGSLLYSIWSINWSSLNALVDVSNNARIILDNLPLTIMGILLKMAYLPMTIFELGETLYPFLAISIILIIANALKGTRPASTTHIFDFLYIYRLQMLGLLAAMASIGMTLVALLLTWTDIGVYGFIDIQGFQGRYVLPILPLLLLVYYMPQKGKRLSGKGINKEIKSNKVKLNK